MCYVSLPQIVPEILVGFIYLPAFSFHWGWGSGGVPAEKIGPHGAGLYHIIFTPDRASLIELQIDHTTQRKHFNNLARWSGHQYSSKGGTNPVSAVATKLMVEEVIARMDLTKHWSMGGCLVYLMGQLEFWSCAASYKWSSVIRMAPYGFRFMAIDFGDKIWWLGSIIPLSGRNVQSLFFMAGEAHSKLQSIGELPRNSVENASSGRRASDSRAIVSVNTRNQYSQDCPL